MAPSKIMTFSEKRRAQDILTAATGRIDALEAKMAGRGAMSEAEMEEYGALNREALEEKLKWLQGECKAQVAGGLLTAAEYATILKEMGERLAALEAEAAKLPSGDKRCEAAAAKIAELTAKRQATTANSARAVMPPLRGAAELVKARGALQRLRRLEKEKSGKLLSVAEARDIGAIPDLEARIQAALEDARGFFESDEEFALRLQNAAAAAQAAGGGGGKKK
jgi:chromosome segregation protein